MPAKLVLPVQRCKDKRTEDQKNQVYYCYLFFVCFLYWIWKSRLKVNKWILSFFSPTTQICPHFLLKYKTSLNTIPLKGISVAKWFKACTCRQHCLLPLRFESFSVHILLWECLLVCLPKIISFLQPLSFPPPSQKWIARYK